MPLTPDLRQRIDQIRDYLYGGGYPDPVSNAEQLSFLFFFYLAEGLDAQAQARARLMKKPIPSIYAGEWALRNPLNAPSFGGGAKIPGDRFRWSQWAACCRARICRGSFAMRYSRSTPKSRPAVPWTSWMVRGW